MSDIESWEMDLDGVLARFGFGFKSRLGRERLSLYVRGLSSP